MILVVKGGLPSYKNWHFRVIFCVKKQNIWFYFSPKFYFEQKSDSKLSVSDKLMKSFVWIVDSTNRCNDFFIYQR